MTILVVLVAAELELRFPTLGAVTAVFELFELPSFWELSAAEDDIFCNTAQT